jgi:hypothetical protein
MLQSNYRITSVKLVQESAFCGYIAAITAKMKTKGMFFALIFFPNPDYITDADSAMYDFGG